MFFDSDLELQEHIQNALKKVNKIIVTLNATLSRPPLIAIYQSFIWPHPDYGDVIYDQTCNPSVHQKPVSIQYNVALATTRAIREKSGEKLIMNQVLNLLREDGGIVNFVAFIKFSRLSCLGITRYYSQKSLYYQK